MTILFDKNKNALISENRAFFVRDRSRLTSTEQVDPTSPLVGFLCAGSSRYFLNKNTA